MKQNQIVMTKTNIEEAMKDTSIYIEDVIHEERMYYFEIPRFGSYFSIRFALKSYFTEKCFLEILEYVKNNYNEDLGKQNLFNSLVYLKRIYPQFVFYSFQGFE